MVQLLADPTLSPSGTPTYEIADGPLMRRPEFVRTDSGNVISREEHALRMRELRELNKKRAMMKVPRRGWSLTDYQGDNESSTTFQSSSSQVDRHASIPEHSALPSTPEVATPNEEPRQEKSQAPRRPKLPPPRRSYSVQDYEPVPPGQPLPGKNYTLLDLPMELHYTIFDFLDPIDSVCFGVTNSNFYEIHRRLHGTVPLSSRYSGPNDREWAWRGAGPLLHRHERQARENAAEEMRVKGQVYCRKCGISRCELHRHLKDWIGEGMEYCSIKECYGKTPGEDARPYCFLKSPKHPNRCGRHGDKKMA